jgi:hypothetical protein
VVMEIDLPGGRGRHSRIAIPGWLDLEDLHELAAGLALIVTLCPDCDDARAEDVLLAMAATAPAALARGLRELAGVPPEPCPEAVALAATIERYRDQLDEIEAARSGKITL